MFLQWPTLAVVLIVLAAASAAMAVYLWRRTSFPAVRMGALLLLVTAEWLLTYTMVLSSATPSAQIFWIKMQFLGSCIIPTLWLILALQSSGQEGWLRPPFLLLLGTVPGVTLFLALTNEAHGLVWTAALPGSPGPLLAPSITYGPWLWVYAAYAYAMVIAGVFLLFQTMVRSRLLYRWQAGLFLAAMVVILAVNILTIFLGRHLFPYALDLTPLALGLIIPLLAGSLSRMQVLAVASVARTRVVESMQDALVVLDDNERVIDMNPAALRLAGQTRAQAIGKPAAMAWPDWYHQAAGLRTQAAESHEIVLSQGQERRFYDSNLSPLTDLRGRLLGQIVVLRDITERRRTEESLRRYFERLQVLHETALSILAAESTETIAHAVLNNLCRLVPCQGATVIMLEPETGDGIFFSAEVEGQLFMPPRRFPRSEVDLVGQAMAPFNGGQSLVVADLAALPQSIPLVQSLLEYGLRSLVAVPLSFQQKPLGVLSLGRSQPNAFTTEEGEVVQEVARSLAIAIQQAQLREEIMLHARRLEESLREKQVLLQLVEQSVDGVVLVNSQGIISEWNKGMEEITGLARETVVGHLPVEVWPQLLPADRQGEGELVHHQLAQFLATQAAPWLNHLQEQKIVHRDGSARMIQVLPFPIVVEHDLSIGFITRDVTRQKQLMTVLLQAETQAAIGRLIASLAHEINNPLQTVTMVLNLLQEMLPAEQIGRYFEMAFDQVERIVRVVEQMDNLYRPDREEKAPSDVNVLLEQVLELQRARCQEGGIEVTRTWGTDLPGVLASSQLRVAFTGLLLNAIEAMAPGNRLALSTSSTKEPPGVQIEFRDSGTGIDPQVLPYIFEPFFSTHAQSLGLGLSISRHIIEQHGGHILAKSQVGQGSTFLVWLPAKEQ